MTESLHPISFVKVSNNFQSFLRDPVNQITWSVFFLHQVTTLIDFTISVILSPISCSYLRTFVRKTDFEEIHSCLLESVVQTWLWTRVRRWTSINTLRTTPPHIPPPPPPPPSNILCKTLQSFPIFRESADQLSSDSTILLLLWILQDFQSIVNPLTIEFIWWIFLGYCLFFPPNLLSASKIHFCAL